MKFLGEYVCSVDEKGRVKMPAAFFKQFPVEDKGTFMLGRDIDDCLVIYPMATWAEQEANLEKLNPYNKEHRNFINVVTAGVSEVEMDNANRFLISKQLMRMLGNSKEVVLKGLFKKIQVWDVNKYEQFIAAQNERVSELADAVSKVFDEKK
ncbi:MAG: division/cell wall cluster transcriptional repressor MraZ [Chitinophagales bacterium]